MKNSRLILYIILLLTSFLFINRSIRADCFYSNEYTEENTPSGEFGSKYFDFLPSALSLCNDKVIVLNSDFDGGGIALWLNNHSIEGKGYNIINVSHIRVDGSYNSFFRNLNLINTNLFDGNEYNLDFSVYNFTFENMRIVEEGREFDGDAGWQYDFWRFTLPKSKIKQILFKNVSFENYNVSSYSIFNFPDNNLGCSELNESKYDAYSDISFINCTFLYDKVFIYNSNNNFIFGSSNCPITRFIKRLSLINSTIDGFILNSDTRNAFLEQTNIRGNVFKNTPFRSQYYTNGKWYIINNTYENCRWLGIFNSYHPEGLDYLVIENNTFNNSTRGFIWIKHDMGWNNETFFGNITIRNNIINNSLYGIIINRCGNFNLTTNSFMDCANTSFDNLVIENNKIYIYKWDIAPIYPFEPLNLAGFDDNKVRGKIEVKDNIIAFVGGYDFPDEDAMIFLYNISNIIFENNIIQNLDNSRQIKYVFDIWSIGGIFRNNKVFGNFETIFPCNQTNYTIKTFGNNFITCYDAETNFSEKNFEGLMAVGIAIFVLGIAYIVIKYLNRRLDR